MLAMVMAGVLLLGAPAQEAEPVAEEAPEELQPLEGPRRAVGLALVTAPVTVMSGLGALTATLTAAACGASCAWSMLGCITGFVFSDPALGPLYAYTVYGVGYAAMYAVPLLAVWWAYAWVILGGFMSVLALGGQVLLDPSLVGFRKGQGWKFDSPVPLLLTLARVGGAWAGAVASAFVMWGAQWVSAGIGFVLLGAALIHLSQVYSARSPGGVLSLAGLTSYSTTDIAAAFVLGGWVGLGVLAITVLGPFVPSGVFATIYLLANPDLWRRIMSNPDPLPAPPEDAAPVTPPRR